MRFIRGLGSGQALQHSRTDAPHAAGRRERSEGPQSHTATKSFPFDMLRCRPSLRSRRPTAGAEYGCSTVELCGPSVLAKHILERVGDQHALGPLFNLFGRGISEALIDCLRQRTEAAGE